MTATRSYFFEVLAEEIPAWMLPPPGLARELTALYHDQLGIDRNAAADRFTVGATSRRLYFNLRDLPARQADRREEIKGPPRKIAFDAAGSPTAALLGFLRKNGLAQEDLPEGDPSDDYIRIEKVARGRAIEEILTEAVPRIVEGIRWPRMMRWGRNDRAWIRPVHSVISLLDESHLPVEIFGVASGTRTRGHRILSTGSIDVRSFEHYVEALGAEHVVVDPATRESMMRQRCEGLAEQIGGVPADDETIWNQWRYLTEFPGIVRAEFDERFLELPEEVLITVMRVHQKQLPISRDGNLSNSFLAVMDLADDHDGNAASGNAFVTNARFADARFFYESDRRRRLEDRIEALAHLQFQEKLGDYRDKTSRIVSIAAGILEDSGAPATRESVRTAARLSKVDLMTDMVKEFTELQGKIGGIYAREEGHPEEIWKAIYDQYRPSGADDSVPSMVTGAILSLADRIDTLAGFFLLGMKPTGSKDPFALRRTAQGAVQILLNRENWRLDLPVDRLIEIGIDAHHPDGTAKTAAAGELLEFFSDRVRTLLESEAYGFAYDEVSAAMASGWANSLIDLHDRAAALRSIRNEARFLSILDSAKRIANITEGAGSNEVNPHLLQEPAEKRLADLGRLVREQIDELVAHKRYREALDAFAAMAPELEIFFDEVLVMAEDPAVRGNRIALLQEVGTSVRMIAEVTRIVIDRSDYSSSGKNE